MQTLKIGSELSGTKDDGWAIFFRERGSIGWFKSFTLKYDVRNDSFSSLPATQNNLMLEVPTPNENGSFLMP